MSKVRNMFGYNWPVRAVAVLSFLLVALVGICSELFLGDETWHFQLASTVYQTGERPTVNPLVHYSDAAHMAYFTDTLWHYGLVFSWKLAGGASVAAAQFYNAVYCLLLIVGTLLLTRELYGSEKELYSVLLTLSVPMVPIFSVILHFDVAVAALASFCLLMLIKRRYFLAGILLGLSILMKRNIYLLIPAIVFLTVFESGSGIKGAGRRLILLTAPVIPITAFDSHFRITNFGLDFLLMWPLLPGRFALKPLPDYTLDTETLPIIPYDYSNFLLNPSAIVTHFGPVLLISLWLYVSNGEKQKADRFILIPLLSSTLIFLLATFLGFTGGMLRYLTPAVPFLVILGAQGVASVKSRTVRYIVLLACAVQFLYALEYISSERRVPKGVKEVYDVIKASFPENTRIMTPWGAQLAFYTGRVSQWGSYCCYREIKYLFWKADEKDALNIMNRYGTDYILVEKDNVYDDSEIRHTGRYPKSFVEKMAGFSFLKPIYENHAATLWAVRKTTPLPETLSKRK